MNTGVVTKHQKEETSQTFELKRIFGFDWKAYRRLYVMKCKKPFLWAVTHGLTIHTYYYKEGIDIRTIILTTPRQVKTFLKMAWHCLDVIILDRWFMAYKIKKGKVVPKSVWTDTSCDLLKTDMV